MKCPKCGSSGSLDPDWHGSFVTCPQCKYDFDPLSYATEDSDDTIEWKLSRRKHRTSGERARARSYHEPRYPGLKQLGKLKWALAILLFMAGAGGFLFDMLSADPAPAASVLMLLGGLIAAVVLLVGSEVVRVMLDIEQQIRKAAALQERTLGAVERLLRRSYDEGE